MGKFDLMYDFGFIDIIISEEFLIEWMGGVWFISLDLIFMDGKIE